MSRGQDARGGRGIALALAAALGVGLGAASGCSTPGVTPSPSSSASASSAAAPSLPPGSTSLRDLGFTNAPAGFAIPVGVTVVSGVNEVSVITAQFSADDGPAVLAFLLANLAAMGHPITASSADSVVFGGDPWHGAFTMNAATALLTLRYRDQ